MNDQNKPIDNIRINDLLWMTIQKHLISFRWKGLPEDVHFTIAFNENSPNINFHITKNVNGIPIDEKPRIEIVKISKSDLNAVIPHLIPSIILKLITPFNLEDFKKKVSKEIKFLPYESLDKHDVSEKTETLLIETFKTISKIEKKTRLKIDGDIENKFIELSTSESLLEIFNQNTHPLSNNSIETTGGLLRIDEDKMIPVIKIENRWFCINTDIQLIDILKVVVPYRLALHLKKYTKYSLVRMRKATTKSDVEQYNAPITLYKVPKN